MVGFVDVGFEVERVWDRNVYSGLSAWGRSGNGQTLSLANHRVQSRFPSLSTNRTRQIFELSNPDVIITKDIGYHDFCCILVRTDTRWIW